MCSVKLSDAESNMHLIRGALRLSQESTECLFVGPEAVCFCCVLVLLGQNPRTGRLKLGEAKARAG